MTNHGRRRSPDCVLGGCPSPRPARGRVGCFAAAPASPSLLRTEAPSEGASVPWATPAWFSPGALVTCCRPLCREPASGSFWEIVLPRLRSELVSSASLQILDLEAAQPVFLGAEPWLNSGEEVGAALCPVVNGGSDPCCRPSAPFPATWPVSWASAVAAEASTIFSCFSVGLLRTQPLLAARAARGRARRGFSSRWRCARLCLSLCAGRGGSAAPPVGCAPPAVGRARGHILRAASAAAQPGRSAQPRLCGQQGPRVPRRCRGRRPPLP